MIEKIFSHLRYLDAFIAWAGYAGLTAVVFSETGLLVGLFLPGDSLLVTAGFVASQSKLDIVTLNALLVIAAIAGDSTGYLIGRFSGPRIFKKEESLFFKKAYLERTHRFFERYGGKTIILARFVPIVRTFAPTVAGVGRMDYRRFLFYNVIGGVLWVLSMTSVGYFLGRVIPNLEEKIHLVVAAVIVISFLPILIEWLKHKR
ncbi:MAG: VTT domain-containing protein [Candidatus Omnitrophica bacterium]|nr:VTT domain-containing protein [Candidatus Omnitrophota bacterium]